MASKTDEITALFTGTSSPDGEHQRWLNDNIDNSATFMGVSISGGVCRAIKDKLKAAEAALKGLTAKTLGITTVSGYQGGGYKAYHSWGLAIDINYVTNPYIMHEAGEGKLDKQLEPVFNRISRFLIINETDHPSPDSVIPQLGRKATDASKVYKALKIENEAMKHYFALMQDGPALLKYLGTDDGKTGYQRAFASGTKGAPEKPDSGFVQRQMQQDWTVLTSKNPLPAIQPAPSNNVPHPEQFDGAPKVDDKTDRPFDGPASQGSPLLKGRSPLSGYLDLSSDLVNTLVSIGFVWGAAGFGNESGDIMHFDARTMSNLKFKDGKSIGDLVAARADWENGARPKPKKKST